MNIAASVPGRSSSILRRTAPVLITSAATAVIAAYVTWMFKPVPAPLLPLARFTISLAAGDQFTNTGVPVVALSPDGSHLVYVANQRLYVRAMEQLASP
jgi:hypothetical protein